MSETLERLGFVDARERLVQGALRSDSVDGYYAMIVSATPLGHSLAEEDAAVQEAVRAKTLANIAPYAKAEGGVEIAATCVAVTARRP
jgi:hypothetical protein